MSRPSDFAERDSGFDDPIQNPQLGAFEWLRWAWRQLTSMRTALLLLLALAVAAVPGSLIPQEGADPNGVVDWKLQNPSLVGIVSFLQGFDVFNSVWFAAIYLLLFVSLIGCVLPRAKHHFGALRAAPPRTPARLGRLPGFRAATVRADPEAAIASAKQLLKARRYRVHRYGDSISAERGYLRETGNLVFHLALVGILITVYVGGGFSYTGQRILVPGQTFTNTQIGYDNLTTGRFFSNALMQDYSVTLKSLAVKYQLPTGEPLDYTARVVAKASASAKPVDETIKVNSPLNIGGTNVYLLGNGYAPHITVRNAKGQVAFSDSVPFLPQDTNLTSRGVVKVPDLISSKFGLGFLGFLYPTATTDATTGIISSGYPDLIHPVLSLNAYTGNLGLDTGQTTNAYVLNTDHLREIAGIDASTKALTMTVGQTVKLPNGLGTIRLDSIARFASLDINHDPTQIWVLIFAILVVAGLLTSLLVPRRRMWIAVTGDDDGELRLEYAALARGDDPNLERAVAEFAEAHHRSLERSEHIDPRVPAEV